MILNKMVLKTLNQVGHKHRTCTKTCWKTRLDIGERVHVRVGVEAQASPSDSVRVHEKKGKRPVLLARISMVRVLDDFFLKWHINTSTKYLFFRIMFYLVLLIPLPCPGVTTKKIGFSCFLFVSCSQ